MARINILQIILNHCVTMDTTTGCTCSQNTTIKHFMLIRKTSILNAMNCTKTPWLGRRWT